jgi:hypothetical protein
MLDTLGARIPVELGLLGGLCKLSIYIWLQTYLYFEQDIR